MTTFVYDSFTPTGVDVDLTAHTGETNATWTSSFGGTIYLRASIGVDGDGSNAVYKASGTPTTADYTVTTTLYNQGGTGSLIGPAIRIQSDTGCYFCWFDGANVIRLYYHDSGGGYTELSNYIGDATTFPSGATKDLKLSAIGTAIKVYFDNVQVISVTDSNIAAAGKPGIAAHSFNGLTYAIDFTADDPSLSSGSSKSILLLGVG